MTDATDKDEKAALDTKVEKYRERSAARVAEIKGALMNWLEPSDTIADSVCITNALLDTSLMRWDDVRGRYVLTGTGRRRIVEGSRAPGTVVSFGKRAILGSSPLHRRSANTNRE